MEARDAEGRTALCVAQAEGNHLVVTALEARGAEPQACGPSVRKGRILIHRAGRKS